MVKIIGICGSPRRKSSYAALREALDGALETGDVEVELIELRARKLNFCIHCNKCLREDAVRCTVYEDDMTALYEKVYQADGMIIASPVYEMNITAQLAAFFNRFRPTWNIIKKDPTFFNRKVGAAIAVGGRGTERNPWILPYTGYGCLQRGSGNLRRSQSLESGGRVRGNGRPGRIKESQGTGCKDG